ncbi:adenosine receptor A2b-like [Orbicella faveolata]|uniref:adenosine receptor A2b-like n=1 Tax=Orbicella faveolata TaxID=48498 RepID=UPI0009E26A18|nr:adenosine receptor A2b-like [Orbicella faveolata]
MMNNTDRHNNGSTDHHSDNEDNSTPQTIIIINCVLNAPLMLISILGNALVLAAIIRTPSIRSTPHMIMLCSLAVSDFLVGLVAQPIYIAKELTKDHYAHYVSVMMGHSLCGVSFLTITAMTMDRFVALHYHMRYATLVTESRVKYTLIIIWLSNFLMSCFNLWNTRVHSLITGLIAIICLIISTFFYVKIYHIVRRHQLQIFAQLQAVQSSDAENYLNIVGLKRSAMNSFVFYIALIICYLPAHVLLTVQGLSHMNDWPTEWEFANTAVFMNSSINPLLYCWRLRELRAAVVKTARQILCKEREQN